MLHATARLVRAARRSEDRLDISSPSKQRNFHTVTHWQLSISWSVWRSWGFNPELFSYFAFDLWILAFGIFAPANFRILSNFSPLKKKLNKIPRHGPSKDLFARRQGPQA